MPDLVTDDDEFNIRLMCNKTLALFSPNPPPPPRPESSKPSPLSRLWFLILGLINPKLMSDTNVAAVETKPDGGVQQTCWQAPTRSRGSESCRGSPQLAATWPGGKTSRTAGRPFHASAAWAAARRRRLSQGGEPMLRHNRAEIIFFLLLSK